MVERLTVYEKPACRKVVALLRERGVAFDRIDSHVEGLPEARLRELAAAGLGPREALRTREPPVAELGLDDPARSDGELLAAMAEHPLLVQRPLVERGDRALLARPPERVLDLLD